MKKIFLLFTCTALLQVARAQDFWIQRDSVNGPGKSVSVAFTAENQGWVVSGLEGNSFTRKMYSYDPVPNDWDNEQSMGGDSGGGLSRGSAVAFSILGKGYVCTGQGDNTDFLNDTWEYDPVNDVWTQKADFPGTARRGATAFVIDAIAYVGTGEDENGLCNDFYKFDPVQNIWGNVAPFSGTPRRHAVGFSMGNQGYVGTGDDGTLRNDFWQYLVFQNAWIQKASFPGTPRSGATGWGNFPTGFIACGEDNTFSYKNDIWEYNYFTNAWTQRTPLPASGRKHPISFFLDGIAYIGTGYNGDKLDDFYAYYQITGIGENENDLHAQVFPNPAADVFTLQSETAFEDGDQLQLYAADGKLLAAPFVLQQGTYSASIGVASFPRGIYWYVVMNEKTGLRTSGEIMLK